MSGPSDQATDKTALVSRWFLAFLILGGGELFFVVTFALVPVVYTAIRNAVGQDALAYAVATALVAGPLFGTAVAAVVRVIRWRRRRAIRMPGVGNHPP